MRRRTIVKAGLASLAGAAALPRVAASQSPPAEPAPKAKGEPLPAQPPVARPVAPAIASDRRDLKMVLAWPRSSPGLGRAADRFAEDIARLTDNRLTVKVFGAGELVPAAETLDAVAGGTADIGHGSSFFWAIRNPAFHFFSGVPFGFTAQEMAAWLLKGGGQALWEELYRPLNIQPFYAGSTGAQAGGWFRHEITAAANFEGLKIRIPGLGAEVVKRLGAIPMMMPAAEITPWLEEGKLDAVAWIGPWSDQALGLPRVAKYYYLPGIQEPGPAIEIIVNRKLFGALSVDHQTAIRVAATAAATDTLADFTYNNAMALPNLVKDGVEVRTFSPDIIKVLAKISKQVVDELAATDALTKRIFSSYQAFWEVCRIYAPLAEGGFLADRKAGFA